MTNSPASCAVCPRVARVTTIADFMREIPARDEERAPVVRLLGFRRESAASFSAQACLSLQGVNPDGEFVWLAEPHSLDWADGQPFDKISASIAQGVSDLEDQVRSYLTARGYSVRTGDYALPEYLKPLGGHFECSSWVRAADGTYSVRSL